MTIDCRVALGGTEAGEVEFAHHVSVHPLLRQCAESAIGAGVYLLLDQRLGNWEGEFLIECGAESFAYFLLGAALLAGEQMFANAGFQGQPGLRSRPAPSRIRRSIQAGCAS